MPGRVLDFEVNYEEKEVERVKVTHWRRHSSGREVRKKLRFILHQTSLAPHRGSSSDNVNQGPLLPDGESDGIPSKARIVISCLTAFFRLSVRLPTAIIS